MNTRWFVDLCVYDFFFNFSFPKHENYNLCALSIDHWTLSWKVIQPWIRWLELEPHSKIIMNNDHIFPFDAGSYVIPKPNKNQNEITRRYLWFVMKKCFSHFLLPALFHHFRLRNVFNGPIQSARKWKILTTETDVASETKEIQRFMETFRPPFIWNYF